MEVITHYPDIEKMVSSLARIADNLDQMTVIMKTEKQIENTLYGMSVARPLPDWDPEELRTEIQDLKLENDRLNQRDEIMLQFIGDLYDQAIDRVITRTEYINRFYGLRERLEEI